jgi:hypothetical protein
VNVDRRAMASVFQAGDPAAFSVAETQAEIMEALERAKADGRDFIELTLANTNQGNRWNGRPVFLSTAPGVIAAVAPPMADRGEGEDEPE